MITLLGRADENYLTSLYLGTSINSKISLEDPYMEMACTTAIHFLEQQLQKSLAETSWALSLPNWDTTYLRMPPITEVTAVFYQDENDETQEYSLANCRISQGVQPWKIQFLEQPTLSLTENPIVVLYNAGVTFDYTLARLMVLTTDYFYNYRGPITQDTINQLPYSLRLLILQNRCKKHD